MNDSSDEMGKKTEDAGRRADKAGDTPAAAVREPPDERALAQLCKEYQAFVDRMLRRSDINPASAESLRQEVMTTFMARVRATKTPTNVHAMLVTITGHEVCNYLRRRARRLARTGTVDFDDVANGQADPEEATIRGEQQRLLMMLLGKLEPEAQRLIHWIDFSGLDYDYVTRTLHIPLETARTRHRRAVEKLEELMVAFYAELEGESREQAKQIRGRATAPAR